MPEFACKMNAWATALTCEWLMGPCKVNDVEVDGGKVSYDRRFRPTAQPWTSSPSELPYFPAEYSMNYLGYFHNIEEQVYTAGFAIHAMLFLPT
eukprot:scaffold40733_cov19-Tisochrysis_lutea.AAC.2